MLQATPERATPQVGPQAPAHGCPPQQAPARGPHWRAALQAVVVHYLDEPFAWGRNDCVSFAADCVQAQHGRDTMAEFRTVRRCEKQARAQLAAGGGLQAGLARAGLAEIPPGYAGVGDLVLLGLGRRRVLAVCNGADALSPGRHCLVATGMQHAVQAWRV